MANNYPMGGICIFGKTREQTGLSPRGCGNQKKPVVFSRWRQQFDATISACFTLMGNAKSWHK